MEFLFLVLIIVIIIIVALFLINGIVIFWITKLFKIENPSLKKSFFILIVYGIAVAIINIILGIIGVGFLSIIIGFFVFHYLFKKYYKNSWTKSFGIYVLSGIIIIIISAAIIVPIRIYVFQPFSVTGDSMKPTYNNGDYLLVNELDKDFSRGDVVVFNTSFIDKTHPVNFFLERVIGTPGDKIEIKDGKVYINDQALNENYTTGQTLSNNPVIFLSQGQYFVLGDNREKTYDSRMFGPVDKFYIIGKIFYKIPGLIK